MIAGLMFDFVGLEQGMSAGDAPLNVVRDLGLTLGLSILVLVGISLAIFARYDLSRERCVQVQELLDETREAA